MTSTAAHVLVLEDDEGLLALATRVLKKQGHRVTAVPDVATAHAEVMRERPDLLIVDYNLQALDTGLDFFRSLRAAGVDVPAIMVSGVSDELRIIEALRAGVSDVLPKTTDYLDDLPEAVERLLAQQALQRHARESAWLLEREQFKDAFVATLSQELRTPLNAIIGWTEYLRRDAADPQALQKGLQVIERNARLQAQRVEDLLDMSRLLAGKLCVDLQQVDLVSVIEGAIASVQSAADARDIRISTALDAAGLILGDPARLQQVVWNLLMNAIKFTPRQGRVTVTLRQRDSEVELEVADNGQGISPELLAGVFERFRQEAGMSRNAGGLGLGLSITRHLVELHGGRVRAESPGPGQGARFCVNLPLAPVARASSGDPADESQSESAGQSTSRES